MPGTLHQGFVWIFRDDPPLAFDLVRMVFAVELPALREFYDRKSELDRFAPCVGDTGELRPDLALSAKHVDSEDPRDGAALILEVLGKVQDLKRWRIQVYWALLAELLKLSTIVLFVPLEDAVAKWARGLGALEIPPRECLLVLDRQNMPRMIDLDEARQRPSMAVLSALIHGPYGDMDVLRLASKIVSEFTDDRRWRYASAILAATPDAERAELMGAMTTMQEHYITQTERRSILFNDGRREGKLEGLAELVLTLFETRSIPVDEAAFDRICACDDPQVLMRWAVQAMTATSPGELFV